MKFGDKLDTIYKSLDNNITEHSKLQTEIEEIKKRVQELETKPAKNSLNLFLWIAAIVGTNLINLIWQNIKIGN